MEFEDYAKRIILIREIETFGQLPKEKQKQNRFNIKNNQMVLEEIEKAKFAQINGKRYYFSDYFKRFLERSQNFQYKATFTNILVLEQTGCGKTIFVQSLGKNKIFGSNLLSVDWVSKINLKKNREDEIRQCLPI